MVATAPGPYLVMRRDDGYGEVFPLQAGQRFTLGRANTNRIVLKDELCSREHAEVALADGRWRLRDLKSLNGTRVNGVALTNDWDLTPGDEVQLGRSALIYVERLEELPVFDQTVQPGDSISIKKRLGQTRFLTPLPPTEDQTEDAPAPKEGKRPLSRDLALLYRLALDMASATTYEELVRIVLDGLLEAVPAEVGAILTMKAGRELEVTARRDLPPTSAPSADSRLGPAPQAGKLDVSAHRHRDPSVRGYAPVSEFVSNEVIASREAILAEDVSRHRYLSVRDSVTSLGATSLICAPVLLGNKVLGLIHLYCTDPHKSLSGEDLEFTMAVAKQLGIVTNLLHERESLTQENQVLRAQLKVESELVGDSPPIQHINEQVGRVAGTNATVLIRGESGVGKELVARALHYSSPRRQGPFVTLNCAAITETLLESELFGHEKGAFTGATEKKIGKFEAAHHGTIFLDEIGEMAVSTQAKLLRILEGHPFERVGGSTPIKVDVRVVAATNQPLEQALQEGKFRRDLFFRLQVVEIHVAPLRERKSDIATLADHFLKRFVRETGRKIRGFTAAAVQKMEQHAWPGNVRELRNVVERAVALSQGPMLDAADIWLSAVELAGPSVPSEPDAYEPMTLEEIEKRYILKTLEHTDWNKSQAANILAIERSTLDRKIKAYQLQRKE